MLKATYLTLILLLFASATQAGGLRFFLHAGYDVGGEKLAKVLDEDGDTISKIRANGGLTFGAGIAVPLGNVLEIQSSIGYKYRSQEAKNGDDVNWKSIPWETSILAHLGHFEVGGGLIYHLSPAYDFNINSSTADIDFDNALGYQAQAAYLIETSAGGDVAVGLRYTGIDFEAEKTTLDGDSIAFFVKYYL